jgi:carbonic anhydrase
MMLFLSVKCTMLNGMIADYNRDLPDRKRLRAEMYRLPRWPLPATLSLSFRTISDEEDRTMSESLPERDAARFSRRGWLKLAAVAGSGGLAYGLDGVDARLQAQKAEKPAPVTTPDQALKALYEGNRRFSEGKPIGPHRSLERVKEVAPKQYPFAAVLGCADSRVPVEIVFDQGIGDVFSVRVAGFLATPEIIGSLEFATTFHGMHLLYVLGHSACGAVEATMKGEAVPGQISSIFPHIQPAAKAAKGDLALAVRLHVRNQMAILAEASPMIAGLVKKGTVKVAGGVYDLVTGKVQPVEM